MFLELRKAKDIWVPSRCTVARTVQYINKSATVIKTAVHPWEPSGQVYSGDYVVNVMRKYPDDPNKTVLKEVCEELGIKLFEPGCELPWEDFKNLIAGARLLVSPYYEASTGGLTLLEGYWHGKPVLLSNSPRNGAVDYFGNNREGVYYFQWDNKNDLAELIEKLFFPSSQSRSWGRPDIKSRREWIAKEYSDLAMAERMANRFREVLG